MDFVLPNISCIDANHETFQKAQEKCRRMWPILMEGGINELEVITATLTLLVTTFIHDRVKPGHRLEAAKGFGQSVEMTLADIEAMPAGSTVQ